jgi:SOS-response transcriptional repressor LexA
MTIKLTKKQLLLLDFIKDFTESHNYSPSYREIMAGVGLKSVSAVAEHIGNLVEKGVIKKTAGSARSLELVDYRHEETVALFKSTLETASDEDKKTLLQAADILGLDLES